MNNLLPRIERLLGVYLNPSETKGMIRITEKSIAGVSSLQPLADRIEALKQRQIDTLTDMHFEVEVDLEDRHAAADILRDYRSWIEDTFGEQAAQRVIDHYLKYDALYRKTLPKLKSLDKTDRLIAKRDGRKIKAIRDNYEVRKYRSRTGKIECINTLINRALHNETTY